MKSNQNLQHHKSTEVDFYSLHIKSYISSSKKSVMKIVLFLLMPFCLPMMLLAQRDPLKWPFAKTSIWNLPIHHNAVYVPAAIQDAVNFEVDEDVIIMTPNEPLMQVETNYTGWSAGGDARCAAQGPTLFVAPIPQNFIFSNTTWHGSTPNSGAAILLSNGKIKQTQPFAKCTNAISTSQYVWDENNCELTGECIVGAHGGSHLSAIGGALRVGEMSSGIIRHVLKLNLFGKENFYNGNGGFRWPATKADGGYNDPAAGNYYGGTNLEMRIGALLAIYKDAVLESVANNSLGIETEPALIIARALQNYGGYTVDNTAWDTYGLITEIGPDGRVSEEFKALYGYDMNFYGNPDNAWARDIKRIFTNLYVVSNNSETSIGGGPVADLTNRRAPAAPDFLPTKSFRIMPLGDSKTEGGGGVGQQSSWRGFLRTKLIRSGYKIDYVGDRQNKADGDTIPNDDDHAGHGGYTIGPDINKFCPSCETTGIFEHIQDYLPAANPDIILLAIGVNDMFGADVHAPNYAATAPQRYRSLVHKILQLKPGIRIIVGSIEPVKWDINWGADPLDNNIGALNADIKALADSSATDNIYFADIRNKMLVNYGPADFWDDLHLSQQGAKKGANAWFDALVPVLNNTPNNIEPTCSITSPANNVTFSAPASITIEVAASDTDGSISKVEFYNGTVKIGEDNTAPFNFTWSNVDEGTYSIKAVAIDNLFGTGTSSEVALTVNSTDGYIKFNGTGNGTPGSYANSGLTFANALDSNAATYFDGASANGQWVGLDVGTAKVVKKIRYIPRPTWALRMVNARIQGANSPDFSDAVNLFTITTVPSEGIYTVARFANTDFYQYHRFLSPDNGYGNVAEIEFWGDPNSPVNQPPSVSLVSPVNNSNYNPGSDIGLSATASDSDGTIAKVEFYSDSTLIGTVTSAPYNFTWANVSTGNYNIKAKATDNLGTTKTSGVVTITVSSTSGNGLYSEDFNANTSVGWIVNGGTWAAANQHFESTNSNGEFTSFYNGSSFSNYTYQLDAVPVWGNDIGFLFNYVDINNYYIVIINVNTNTAYLKKNINGTLSVLATAAFAGNGLGGSNSIMITNTGTATTVKINNSLIFDNISTTELASGKIGLYSFYCPSSFDNILVTSNQVVPAVNITLPASGSTFSAPATIEIAAIVSGFAATIAKVEFFSGATLIGTDVVSPYSFTWQNVAEGNYTITAKGTDEGGVIVTSPVVNVIVKVPADESVAFSNPPLVVNPGNSYTVNVDYVATENRIIDVYLFNSNWQSIASKNVSIAAGSGTQSVQITIPSSAAAAANCIWAVNLWKGDWSGIVKSANSFGATVNALPVVGITSPLASSTFDAPAAIALTATSSDPDGAIATIDFYNGATLIGSVSQSPFTFTWLNVAAGNYSITAKATDNMGSSATSSVVNIIVNAPIQESIAFNNPAAVVNAGNTYSVNIDYVSAESRIIDVYLFNSNWQTIASKNVHIAAGTGTQVVQITIPADAAAVTNGIWSVNLWKGDWSGIVKSATFFGVTVNAVPSFTITASATPGITIAPASVLLSASPTRQGGSIASVAFYNGQQLIGTSTASPYTFNWMNVAVGNYTLTAKATDNTGQSVTSVPFAVSVVDGKLNLTSMCSANPLLTRRWRVTSTYTIPVQFNWNVYGTTQSGTASVAEKGTVYFETATLAGANTTIITYGSKGKVTKASGGAACSAFNAKGNYTRSDDKIKDEKASFDIYPVPVKDGFTIRQRGFRNPHIIITNLMNQVVYAARTSEGIFIETSKLSKGIYMVTLHDGMNTVNKKIIVE